MNENQLAGVQQKALEIESFPEIGVMAGFSVGRVTDQWMTDVFQMTSDLVASTGQRLDFKQGIACRGIAVDSIRPFDRGDKPDLCSCFLVCSGLRPRSVCRVVLFLNRVIDQ